MADWRIGEIKQVNGEWYQCIKGLGCNECDLSKITCYHRFESGSCSPNMRKDGTQVIFKKLEKVGEPYKFNGHIFQAYRTCEVPIFTENYVTVRELGNDSKISIEIKQNKEDMEQEIEYFGDENTNYSNSEKIGKNLKPFDLQKAREGKPVCTMSRKKARIICFDAKGILPIIALVESGDEEKTVRYSNSGRFRFDGTPDEEDLMMLPEKKERWVNVYHNEKGEYWSEQVLFSTKKEAIEFVHNYAQYVTTVKIEWEE